MRELKAQETDWWQNYLNLKTKSKIKSTTQGKRQVSLMIK